VGRRVTWFIGTPQGRKRMPKRHRPGMGRGQERNGSMWGRMRQCSVGKKTDGAEASKGAGEGPHRSEDWGRTKRGGVSFSVEIPLKPTCHREKRQRRLSCFASPWAWRSGQGSDPHLRSGDCFADARNDKTWWPGPAPERVSTDLPAPPETAASCQTGGVWYNRMLGPPLAP
jgi:hypothetical protein